MHTRTHRIAGVQISPTKHTVECDEKWNRAIRWAMGDFGFRNCPIFCTEILSAKLETGIELSNLQCYTKNKDYINHTLFEQKTNATTSKCRRSKRTSTQEYCRMGVETEKNAMQLA